MTNPGRFGFGIVKKIARLIEQDAEVAEPLTAGQGLNQPRLASFCEAVPLQQRID
jgi:hypothetical protein